MYPIVSLDNKKFNVMLTCLQAESAWKIIQVNGRTKIRLLHDNPQYARWTQDEIDMYIVENQSAELPGLVSSRLISLG